MIDEDYIQHLRNDISNNKNKILIYEDFQKYTYGKINKLINKKIDK